MNLRTKTDKKGRVYVVIGKKKYILSNTRKEYESYNPMVLNKLNEQLKMVKKKVGKTQNIGRQRYNKSRGEELKARTGITQQVVDLTKKLKDLENNYNQDKIKLKAYESENSKLNEEKKSLKRKNLEDEAKNALLTMTFGSFKKKFENSDDVALEKLTRKKRKALVFDEFGKLTDKQLQKIADQKSGGIDDESATEIEKLRGEALRSIIDPYTIDEAQRNIDNLALKFVSQASEAVNDVFMGRPDAVAQSGYKGLSDAESDIERAQAEIVADERSDERVASDKQRLDDAMGNGLPTIHEVEVLDVLGGGVLNDSLTGKQVQDIGFKYADSFIGVCFEDDIAKFYEDNDEDNDVVSIIYNTMHSDGGGVKVDGEELQHYCLLRIDHAQERVLCYDPLGLDISPTLNQQIGKILEGTPSLYKIKYNTVVGQNVDSSICGFICLDVLKRLEDGDSWVEATLYNKIDGSKMGEESALKLKKKIEKFEWA